MYKRARILNSNSVQTPVAFYAGDDAITIRTLVMFGGDAEMPSEEATLAVLAKHGPKMDLTAGVRSEFSVPLNGAVVGLPGVKLCVSDQVLLERNADLYGIGIDSDRCVLMTMLDPANATIQMPFNRTAYTEQERMNKYALYRRMMAPSLLTINSDFAEDKWFDAQVTFKYNFDVGGLVLFDDTAQGTVLDTHRSNKTDLDLPQGTVKLTCDAATVAPGGTVEITVQSVDGYGSPVAKSSTIYLEPVYGYLPKTRVVLNDGVAKFKLMALGLDAGDTLRVKAGFRFVPGLDDLSIAVE